MYIYLHTPSLGLPPCKADSRPYVYLSTYATHRKKIFYFCHILKIARIYIYNVPAGEIACGGEISPAAMLWSRLRRRTKKVCIFIYLCIFIYIRLYHPTTRFTVRSEEGVKGAWFARDFAARQDGFCDERLCAFQAKMVKHRRKRPVKKSLSLPMNGAKQRKERSYCSALALVQRRPLYGNLNKKINLL